MSLTQDNDAVASLDRLLSSKTIRRLIDVPDRTLRRWIAGGRFPRPDRRIGKTLRWRESTVRRWMEGA